MADPDHHRGSRLPRLAAPAGGANERIVLRPPTEAKPPGLNPRYPRGSRLPRLAVAEEADGQEAWIQAAHSDTVSPRARALGAASSQETSPGQTPPGEEVVYFSAVVFKLWGARPTEFFRGEFFRGGAT